MLCLQPKTAQILDDTESDHEVIQRLNQLGDSKSDKHMVEVFLNGKNVIMEFDSGAPCTVISKATLRSVMGNARLLKTNRRLSDYSHNRLVVLGRVVVDARVGSTTRKLNVYIIDGDYDSLFGREWIEEFVHEFDFIKMFSSSEPVRAIKMATPHISPGETQLLQQLLNSFDNIFSDSTGKLNIPPIKLHLRQDAKPVFAKARENHLP